MRGFLAMVFFPIASLVPWRKILPYTTLVNPRRNAPALERIQQPDHKHRNRVHVFHGTFDSERDVAKYCTESPSKNRPEPLNHDLPDATVNTSEVEIVFGGARIGAKIPTLTKQPDGVFHQVGSSNTVVLLTEAAFCGLPYKLNDTPKLRYAGALDVTEEALSS